MSSAAKRSREVSSILGTRRADLFILATAATALWGLASASTSLPSSSSELCPGETAACYDSPFCWNCVAQFEEDSFEFCQERYPVLADAGASECDKYSALFCCSFDVSDQDCAADAVTVDYFRCGMEESGCTFPESLCSSVGGRPNRAATPDDPAPATPAPVAADTASPDHPTTSPVGIPIPTSPPTTSPVATPVPTSPPTGIPSTPSVSTSPPTAPGAVETEPPTLSAPLTEAPATVTPVLPSTPNPASPPTGTPFTPSVSPNDLKTPSPSAADAVETEPPTLRLPAPLTAAPAPEVTPSATSKPTTVPDASPTANPSSVTSSGSSLRGVGLTPAPVATAIPSTQPPPVLSSTQPPPVLPSTSAPAREVTPPPTASVEPAQTASPTANPTASPEAVEAAEASLPSAMKTVPPSSGSTSSSVLSSSSSLRDVGLTPAPVAAALDDDPVGDEDTPVVGVMSALNGGVSHRRGMSGTKTLFASCVGLVGAWATAAGLA